MFDVNAANHWWQHPQHKHTHIHTHRTKSQQNDFLGTALVNWSANFIVCLLAELNAGMRERETM